MMAPTHFYYLNPSDEDHSSIKQTGIKLLLRVIMALVLFLYIMWEIKAEKTEKML